MGTSNAPWFAQSSYNKRNVRPLLSPPGGGGEGAYFISDPKRGALNRERDGRGPI